MRSKSVFKLILALSVTVFVAPAIGRACPSCDKHKAASAAAAAEGTTKGAQAADAAQPATGGSPGSCPFKSGQAADTAQPSGAAAEMNCPEGCCTEKCKGDCPGMQGGKCPNAQAAPSDQPKQ